MNESKKQEYKSWSLLGLRIVIAAIFLYHGLPKATQWGMAMEKFVGMGFPGFLGPIVGIAEVIGAILIIVGLWHAWANYALAGIIVVAIIGVQIPGAMKAGKLLTAGLERDLLILTANLVLAFHGPGKWAKKS
jgi:putative oxidoreductase